MKEEISIIVKDPITEPCGRFFWEYNEIIRFTRHILSLSAFSDVSYEAFSLLTYIITPLSQLIKNTLENEPNQIDVNIDLNRDEIHDKLIRIIKHAKIMFPKSSNIDISQSDLENLDHEALLSLVCDKFNIERDMVYKINRKESISQISRFKEFERLIFEMTYSRGVDNFLCYISELITLIFRTRPEIIKYRSRETVTVGEIMEFGSMEELIGYIVERRVLNLSHEGVLNLNQELSKQLDFCLFDKEHIQNAKRIIEIRNIIIHNRAVVNRHFLERVPNSSKKEGQLVDVGSVIVDDLDSLAKSVLDIDNRAANKFKLARPIVERIENPDTMRAT